MKKNQLPKIIIVLVLSYFISSLAMRRLFIVNSPQLKMFASTSNVANPTISVKSFKTEAKGIYSQTSGNYTKMLYKKNEIEWQEYTYIVNGRQVKIKVPRGLTPPAKELIERLYK